MSEIVPIRPIHWDALRSDEAERVVRERLERGGVIYTFHADKERSPQRSIPRAEIDRILRTGYAGQPYRNEYGDWQVEISRTSKGRREAVVLTIIPEEIPQIIVRTVMWRD